MFKIFFVKYQPNKGGYYTRKKNGHTLMNYKEYKNYKRHNDQVTEIHILFKGIYPKLIERI